MSDSEVLEDGPRRALKSFTFGKMMYTVGRYEAAVKHLKYAVQYHAFPAVMFHLGSSYLGLKNWTEGLYWLTKAVEAKPDFYSAHINRSAALQALEELDEAEKSCLRALEINSKSREAVMNLTNIYRNKGNAKQAMDLVDQKLQEVFPNKPTIPEAMNASVPRLSPPKNSELIICCVKWGTLYGANYVNNLFNGIKRHIGKYSNFCPEPSNSKASSSSGDGARPWHLVCFTDDPEGLDTDIKSKDLPQDLKGWWGKSYLFSKAAGFDGSDVMFLDLDVIIDGDIGLIVNEWRKPEVNGNYSLLGVLGVDDIDCELAVGVGFNSSVLLWRDCDELRRIFDYIDDAVFTFVHRFDHWLERNISQPKFLNKMPNPNFIDCEIDEHRNMIIDFCHTFKVRPDDPSGRIGVLVSSPPDSAIVTIFPRWPKPHDLLQVESLKTHFQVWVEKSWGLIDSNVVIDVSVSDCWDQLLAK